MKKVAAVLLTLGLFGALVYLSHRRTRTDSESPEGVIWRIWEESKTGRVDRYLDCFTGIMRAQLESTAQGMTPPGFSEYLKESSGKVKGLAIHGLQKTAPDQANLTVEYIYSDKNERQRINLKLEGGRWRVAAAESSQRIQPLVPYGKPVTDP
jgi:hypothetical protein